MFPWVKNGKKDKWQARTPPHTRIYAIGDIHGRLDLLQEMQALIKEDAASAADGVRKMIIYLGDYIDRGDKGRQVIDSFINNKIDGFEQVFIKGNHEKAMLDFLESPASGEMWMVWGGSTTMQSYGVSLEDAHGNGYKIEDLQVAFKSAVPEAHVRFLKNLPINHVEGDYFFVHAGVKPQVELAAQNDSDMMMIRGEFIYSENPLPGKVVVFGHTIFDEPYCGGRKIGVDTGAYATGKLTAVVLEDGSVRFITT